MKTSLLENFKFLIVMSILLLGTLLPKTTVVPVMQNSLSNKMGFGANPCKVINQVTNIDNKKICQFSWVCENKAPPNKRDARYIKSLQTAYEVMVLGMYKDVVPRSTLFFHNTTVQPNWPYRKVAEIGNHIFYSKIYKK